jgi:Zn-dependent protease with chaperone function
MELDRQAKFDSLVRKLERTARQQTTNYQLRVALLAAIGYGYIALICFFLFGSLWVVRWTIESIQHHPVAIDPNQLWLLFGLVAISTFWVQYIPLKDREIHRTEFPELFDSIDELRHRLKAPPIHHVVINYDHNAAIYQAPRLGLFGWYRNYLILGLPLLQSLTPEQFKATLAHELGHLAGNDSQFVGWVYRVRYMWEQLTQDNNFFVFQWFFRWYEPLIKAYSLVLIRDREYAADALAKRMTDPEITASDLIQTYIYHHYLEECFGRQLDRQARDRDTPPKDVVTQMLASLRQPLDPTAAGIWLGLALGEATDTDDTHPCLSDRLVAVGYPTPKSWIPQPILRTAAEHFFGDRLAELAKDLDSQWYNHRQTAWLRQYQRGQYQREHLALLDLLATTQRLTFSQSIVRAELTGELRDELTALPLWEEILDRSPHHPFANYQLGKILLSRGHQRGCTYLERSIALDPDLVIPSCEELYRFYTYQGKSDLAQIYLAWRQQHLPKQWRSQLDRKIKATDLFIPHDLAPDLVSEIRTQLIQHRLIRRAYLVRKPMPLFPDHHIYILAIKLANTRGRNLSPQESSHPPRLQSDEQIERELCERLSIEINLGKRSIIAIFDRHNSGFNSQGHSQLITNIEGVSGGCIL